MHVNRLFVTVVDGHHLAKLCRVCGLEILLCAEGTLEGCSESVAFQEGDAADVLVAGLCIMSIVSVSICG